jgi:hypothetical protein
MNASLLIYVGVAKSKRLPEWLITPNTMQKCEKKYSCAQTA